MSKNNKNKAKAAKKGRSAREREVSAAARRKQVIAGLVMGAIVGVVISAITQFWLWLPAGLALGLATGVIMKPPQP